VPTLVSKMWHFPTIAATDDPAAELERYLEAVFSKEEIRRWILTPLNRVRHAVTYRNLTVYPFRVNVLKLPSVSGSKIVAIDNLSSLPVSSLTRKIGCSADRPSRS
jgi:adenine-specific DNA glycosylase